MPEREITYLKGVGPARAKLFNKLKVYSVGDLLKYYPINYKDFSSVSLLCEGRIGESITVKLTITSVLAPRKIKSKMIIYSFYAEDESDNIKINIFNNNYLADTLEEGREYIFSGKLEAFGGIYQMNSPEVVRVDAAGIVPVYRLTSGMYPANVRNAVKNALEYIPDDTLPEEILSKYGLCSLNYALNNIHFPKSMDALRRAKRRLIFEEFFLFQLGVSLMKQSNVSRTAPLITGVEEDISAFKSKLPFTLTDSQEKVINECLKDMASGVQMNRLIEGDVGSGKTVISAALMYAVASKGYQCAMMAPTEILAEQHYASLCKFYEGSPIEVCLLTGGGTKKQREAKREALRSGLAHIAVGTQALVQKDVEFNNLALVITDEQHRFGVAQRANLADKGKSPHILIMSATPIPRTLSLIMYKDLDISIVDKAPSNRQKIDTFYVNSGYRMRIFNFIKKAVNEGRQAYIVCPLVEESESMENVLSAEEYYKTLVTKYFATDKYRIGLLHGKLKNKEKDAVMKKFAEGEIDILVSTTVIEVGVDVPNSTIMVIENAERFGLSALHQLRGRVGRGEHKSYCILISDAANPEAQNRLNTMVKTDNGFKIAEEDLAMRGPGDFIGNRQHGMPGFKIADLATNMEELHLATSAVNDVLNDVDFFKSDANKKLYDNILAVFEDKFNEMN